MECLNVIDEQKSTKRLDEVWNWPEIPPGIPGEGFRRISLHKGIELIIIDLQLNEDFIFKVETNCTSLEIGCSLSGYVRGSVTSREGQRENFNCGPEDTWFSFYPSSEGTIEYLCGDPIRAINILINPALLDVFIDTGSDNIPVYLRGILEGSTETYCSRMGKINGFMHKAIHQIYNCPYNGFLRRMFLEAKVLELLTYLLDGEAMIQCLPPICTDKEDRIHHARDILINNLENPPSLFDLARSVGLCTTKLTMGFRRVFGISVFGYLRKQRLGRAGHLLEKEGKTVSEAAWEVGYQSLSSFHRAFVKEYGINPSSRRVKNI